MTSSPSPLSSLLSHLSLILFAFLEVLELGFPLPALSCIPFRGCCVCLDLSPSLYIPKCDHMLLSQGDIFSLLLCMTNA